MSRAKYKISNIFAVFFIYKISKGSCFFRDFKRRHPDLALVNQLDKLVTVRCKLLKSRLSLRFVTGCIEDGVYTQYLQKRIKQNHLKATPDVCERFLQTEKADLVQLVASLSASVSSLGQNLHLLGLVDFCRFLKFSGSVLARIRTSEERKFNGIRAAHLPTRRLTDLDKHIVNLSSYDLSLIEKQALRCGLDFCIPPDEVCRIPLEAEIENVFHQVQGLQPVSDVSEFTNSLVYTANSYRRSPIEKGGLTPEHITSLCALKKRDDLIIIRPDKGSGVVLLDRPDYNAKMDTILCDNSKFISDTKQKDCVKTVVSSLSSLLNELVEANAISKEFRSFLLSSGHSVPRLYGLPKTHKPECPLRPTIYDRFPYAQNRQLVREAPPTCPRILWQILCEGHLRVCKYYSRF